MTKVVPPREASRSKGPSVCENASLPHGKPPKGPADRPISQVVHATAKPRAPSQGWPTNKRERLIQIHVDMLNPMAIAWARDSATHGMMPTAS